jgi:hypothetical protein
MAAAALELTGDEVAEIQEVQIEARGGRYPPVNERATNR